jgi:ABC-type sugar transport system ATPase subunit
MNSDPVRLPTSDSANAPALEVDSLSKSFGGVKALTDVSLALDSGEVLALIGDNGAGKSTLVKCLSGVLAPDSGSIRMHGKDVRIESPRDAHALGIETVYQDLALVETLDVASNLFLNREVLSRNPLLRWLVWLDKRRMYRESEQILQSLQIRIPSARQEVTHLSGGQRQAIAIGRAVAWGRHIVLMDEPAAALGVAQAEQVLDLVRTLSNQGVAVLFISHNMQQVIDVCDRAVVLRHGRRVADVRTSQATVRDLVDMVTGAPVDHAMDPA